MVSDIETKGGASIAASRLAYSLCRAGHHVIRLVPAADGDPHAWQTRIVGGGLSRTRALRVLPGAAEHWVARALRRALADIEPDVVNIHNLHGASGWSTAVVRIAAECAPTVWTLHDMWSFTGRCAYSYDCRKFPAGCDAACPTPREYPALAPRRIARAWESRRELLGACLPHPLVAVSPSRWLASEARAGLWGSESVDVIPYGLPLDVFAPVERRAARQALGIDPHGPVLMTAAADYRERRKGTVLLKRALHAMPRRPLTVVTLGAGAEGFSLPNVHECHLGFVNRDDTKALAYSAADLFVHPALTDNLPNVVMEAISCGTPVLGFAVGGLLDMVRPGLSGWLAPEVSAQALATAIGESLDEVAGNGRIRESCRAIATAEYGDDLQAARYAALFSRLRMSRDAAPER
jgi:glycosyltransferase involved in cell wall biosynthesis